MRARVALERAGVSWRTRDVGGHWRRTTPLTSLPGAQRLPAARRAQAVFASGGVDRLRIPPAEPSLAARRAGALVGGADGDGEQATRLSFAEGWSSACVRRGTRRRSSSKQARHTPGAVPVRSPSRARARIMLRSPDWTFMDPDNETPVTPTSRRQPARPQDDRHQLQADYLSFSGGRPEASAGLLPTLPYHCGSRGDAGADDARN